MVADSSQTGAALVPCSGGPNGVGWLRVDLPIPLEVDRGGDGIYVLDGEEGVDEYVWVPYRP
jgi:hypothetical protein